jgi:hypothetical protein
MYNQQQSALSQSNASPKKPGPKRKNTQQGNNLSAPGRINNKQSAQFIPNPMQANGVMAGQHYQQQFSQSNPIYNPMGQPNMQHVAQMNQQQMLAQQQMMANGSPQFSSPQTPINASPYSNK